MKDVESFKNQMFYNIALCHLQTGNLQDASKILTQIYLPPNLPFYQDFIDFKAALELGKPYLKN